MRVVPHLEALAESALARCHGVEAPALLKPADPAHGDYQVNGVMPLAKRLGKPPRELAAPVAAALAESEAIASAEVAGPGFINLTLSPAWLGTTLAAAARDTERDGVPEVERPQRIVIDYSAPNIAKELGVGHMRSTFLGDAIYRLLKFVGHAALGDNHVGDWGTQYGLIIAGLRRFGSMEAFEADPMVELGRVYVEANKLAKEDAAFADTAREELAKLQRGDAENLAMWQRFIDATRAVLDQLYARIGVEFDLWRGESSYEEMLPGVVELLLEKGIAREDQGAICVFFEDDPVLKKTKTPFIVRKKDGAYLYSTTDLATILYRRDELKTERSLYVVDKRQSLHFQQLFATVRKLGVEMELEHIAFGTILDKAGKPLKTREGGGAVTLRALLDEAEERAVTLMREEGIEVEPERLPELSHAVGVGAVKYADLCQNRMSDYRFDWDKLISLKGNASPYLQYAHARVRSIFRRGEIDPAELDTEAPLSLEHEDEVALARELLRFADTVHQAAEGSTPHVVCDHLYAVARAFSGFFERCPVLKAEGETRRTRLLLCWLTARQLARGLHLLGIEAPERM